MLLNNVIKTWDVDVVISSGSGTGVVIVGAKVVASVISALGSVAIDVTAKVEGEVSLISSSVVGIGEVTLSKPFGSSVDWAFSTVMPVGILGAVVVSGTADEIKHFKY